MEQEGNQTITIFSLNAYLVPSWFLIPGEEKHCINLEQRALSIGKVSLDYNIVSLQELWGPCSKCLSNFMEKSHEVSGSLCTGFDLLDTWLSWGSGALWFAHQRDMFNVLSKSSVEYQNTNHSVHRKSFTFHLLGFKKEFSNSNKKLLVITTHLDPSNDNHVITKQLVQLSNYIIDWIKEYKGETKSLTIILNGDFNIDSKSDTYSQFINLFGLDMKISDLYDSYIKKNNQEEQFTFSKLENDLVFWDYTGRIDYVFSITKIDISKKAMINEMNQIVLCSSDQNNSLSQIVHFNTPTIQNCEIMKYKKGEELSDHFGVSVTILI